MRARLFCASRTNQGILRSVTRQGEKCSDHGNSLTVSMGNKTTVLKTGFSTVSLGGAQAEDQYPHTTRRVVSGTQR